MQASPTSSHSPPLGTRTEPGDQWDERFRNPGENEREPPHAHRSRSAQVIAVEDRNALDNRVSPFLGVCIPSLSRRRRSERLGLHPAIADAEVFELERFAEFVVDQVSVGFECVGSGVVAHPALQAQ